MLFSKLPLSIGVRHVSDSGTRQWKCDDYD
jgi:hypothetical protein